MEKRRGEGRARGYVWFVFTSLIGWTAVAEGTCGYCLDLVCYCYRRYEKDKDTEVEKMMAIKKRKKKKERKKRERRWNKSNII